MALAGYAVAGVVVAGTNATTFSTALAQPAGWFSLGKVAFTGGANAGATVTVKTYDGAGTFQLVAPLQATPQRRRRLYRLSRLRPVHGRLRLQVRQPGALPRPAVHSRPLNRFAHVNAALRQAVVAEALSWLGTPYAHRQQLKSVGVDCAQLPLAVYAAAGVIGEADVGAYAAQWHLHRGEELYLAPPAGARRP